MKSKSNVGAQRIRGVRFRDALNSRVFAGIADPARGRLAGAHEAGVDSRFCANVFARSGYRFGRQLRPLSPRAFCPANRFVSGHCLCPRSIDLHSLEGLGETLPEKQVLAGRWVSAEKIADELDAIKGSVHAWIVDKGVPAPTVRRFGKVQSSEVDNWICGDGAADSTNDQPRN